MCRSSTDSAARTASWSSSASVPHPRETMARPLASGNFGRQPDRMRLVYILFDSLNRHALGAYGGSAVATPDFDRPAARSVVFGPHYVGSLPWMPARRDLHTGRP